MKAKVLQFCREESLFESGDRVICAVSGGADSVAMLHCLYSLKEELDIHLSAAHYNHGLRGEEAQRDADFTLRFCEKLGVRCHVGSGDVADFAKKEGKSTELAAREMRYAYLQSLDCHKLATAHTADDNTETVLLHLLRGSGLRGLGGIPPKRGKIVRPLLSLTRQEIEDYLREQGIDYVTDSSNEQDFCRRNRLRHRVIPLLKEEMSGLNAQMFRQSRLLRAEDTFLDALAHKLLQEAKCGDAYDRKTLLQADPVLQARALRLMLPESFRRELSMRHIQSLQKLLKAPVPSARIDLPLGISICRNFERLEIRQREPVPRCPLRELKIPGETIIEEAGVKICCIFRENFQKIVNTPFHFALKYDMISQSGIFLRARQTGDRLLMNDGHHKSLKKLFIEKKIPLLQRQRLPIFTNGEEILAVAGIGVSPLYRAQSGDSALIIYTEIKEM